MAVEAVESSSEAEAPSRTGSAQESQESGGQEGSSGAREGPAEEEDSTPVGWLQGDRMSESEQAEPPQEEDLSSLMQGFGDNFGLNVKGGPADARPAEAVDPPAEWLHGLQNKVGEWGQAAAGQVQALREAAGQRFEQARETVAQTLEAGGSWLDEHRPSPEDLLTAALPGNVWGAQVELLGHGLQWAGRGLNQVADKLGELSQAQRLPDEVESALGVLAGGAGFVGDLADGVGGLGVAEGRLARGDAETWGSTLAGAQGLLEGTLYGSGQAHGLIADALTQAGDATGLDVLRQVGLQAGEWARRERSLASDATRQAMERLEGAGQNLLGRAAEGGGEVLRRLGQATGLASVDQAGMVASNWGQQAATRDNPLVQALDESMRGRMEEYERNGPFALSRDVTRLGLEVGSLLVGPEVLAGKLGLGAAKGAETGAQLVKGAETWAQLASGSGVEFMDLARSLKGPNASLQEVERLAYNLRVPDRLAGTTSTPDDILNLARKLAAEPGPPAGAAHPWGWDPYDRSARFQVWGQNWRRDPFYLTLARESAADLAARPPANVRELLDRIAESPMALDRLANAPDPFFAEHGFKWRADGKTWTTSFGNDHYGNMGGEFGRVADRARDGLVVEQAGSQPVSLTGTLQGNWWHTYLDQPGLDRILDHVDTLYARALQAPTLEKAVQTTGELHWWLAQAMPFGRGSASAADVAARAILDMRGIETSVLKPGVGLDLEALVRPREDYVRNYANFFYRPPRWLPGAAPTSVPALLGRPALRAGVRSGIASQEGDNR